MTELHPSYLTLPTYIDLSRAKLTINNIVHKKKFKANLLEVERITWLYKISPGTADFRRGDDITEIEVFSVVFKSGEANKSDLAAIQKAIPYPILFTVSAKALEPTNEASGNAHIDICERGRFAKGATFYFIVEGEVFESDKELLNGDTLMIERRSAKLTDLYEDIATTFIPIDRKTGESLSDTVNRYKALQTIDREIERLQVKVDNEKQTNKRFEYNEELKQLMAERRTKE